MRSLRIWMEEHPGIKEFILFNILSNCATLTNFIMMWICTGFLFRNLSKVPFRFFIFDYESNMESNLGLCGFLSFLLATFAAQTVNFLVQKKFVFKSDAAFEKAVPKYIIFAVVLIILSTALPAYSQVFLIRCGVSPSLTPTLANAINILMQVLISFPAMKFWIMKS